MIWVCRMGGLQNYGYVFWIMKLLNLYKDIKNYLRSSGQHYEWMELTETNFQFWVHLVSLIIAIEYCTTWNLMKSIFISYGRLQFISIIDQSQTTTYMIPKWSLQKLSYLASTQSEDIHESWPYKFFFFFFFGWINKNIFWIFEVHICSFVSCSYVRLLACLW